MPRWSLAAQLELVETELAARRRTYTTFVAERLLTTTQAAHELEGWASVVQTLRELAERPVTRRTERGDKSYSQ